MVVSCVVTILTTFTFFMVVWLQYLQYKHFSWLYGYNTYNIYIFHMCVEYNIYNIYSSHMCVVKIFTFRTVMWLSTNGSTILTSSTCWSWRIRKNQRRRWLFASGFSPPIRPDLQLNTIQPLGRDKINLHGKKELSPC